MDKFIIAEDLAQALLNYLAPRPFIEVHQLISALQAMPKVEEKKRKVKHVEG